ncbi:MAG: FtsX-like permease family protein, partial [Prevotella sp.]|nr:FtsX-like permease family protein [Prevotella sp.]
RDQILRQLTSVEGVESAYLYEQEFGAVGYSRPAFNECVVGGDTLYLAVINFNSDAHFFETYGLKPLPGSPSAAELSRLSYQEQQVVLTHSGAIALFGTADVVGRHLTICYDPAIEATVAGVVEDFRMSVSNTIHSMIIKPQKPQYTTCRYVIRLKKGQNARHFVEEHGQELIHSGQTGFSRISRLMTFDEYLQRLELDDGRTQEVNRSSALALFFLINLMLAVIGTVWLHAKRRTEECGVRRAFGATRGRLLFDFLWRNALLATAAVVVGLIIYLNYAHSGIQVYNGEEYCETLYTIDAAILPTDRAWPEHFWPHFLVVSAAVYIIILCTVLIGTAIPAVKIIGARITNALRDE